MFKDAFLQEAIVDKVRAIEFDMESTSVAEVGSLLNEVADAPNGFQRIADEEDAGAIAKPGARSRAKTTTKKTDKKAPAKTRRSASRTKTKKAGSAEAALADAQASEREPSDIARWPFARRRGRRRGGRGATYSTEPLNRRYRIKRF